MQRNRSLPIRCLRCKRDTKGTNGPKIDESLSYRTEDACPRNEMVSVFINVILWLQPASISRRDALLDTIKPDLTE